MLIPINLLRGAQMTVRRKLCLGLIFSLTIITIVFSIVRASVASSWTGPPDDSWLFMWTFIETTVGKTPIPLPLFLASDYYGSAIVVVCLAAIRNLFSSQEPPSQAARYEPTQWRDPIFRSNKRRYMQQQSFDTLTDTRPHHTYIGAESPRDQVCHEDVILEGSLIPLESIHVQRIVEASLEAAQ